MCSKKRKQSKNKTAPFLVLLSIGCTKPGSKNVFRIRFYIKGFKTINQANNFSVRLSDFITASAECEIMTAHLWIVRPLSIISPIKQELMTQAKKHAIELSARTLPAENNFNIILSRIFESFEISSNMRKN